MTASGASRQFNSKSYTALSRRDLITLPYTQVYSSARAPISPEFLPSFLSESQIFRRASYLYSRTELG